MKEKYDELHDKNIRWHMIGHLQTNKVKYIADYVYLIHSVDSEKLAEEIQKQAEKRNKVLDVLVQVNRKRRDAEIGELILTKLKKFLVDFVLV